MSEKLSQAPVTVSRLHDLVEITKRKATKGLTVAVIGASTISLVACSSNEASTKPATTHSFEVPTTTPTPEATPDKMPAALEAADEATYNNGDFLKLPLQEREKWCSWQNRDLSDIAADWESHTNDPKDKLPVLTADSGAEDLLTYSTYVIRSAWVSHQKALDIFDKNTSDKVLSCAFTNPNSNSSIRQLNVLNTAYDAGSTGFTAGSDANHSDLQMGTITGPVDHTIINGNPTYYADVVFPNESKEKVILTNNKGLDYNNQPIYYATLEYSY